jgi:hypothetical protein
MHRQRSPRYTHSYLDSCAFDGPEEQCSSRLLDLCREGRIHLEIAHSVVKEIVHPNTPPAVISEARQLVYTNETSLTRSQVQRRSEIRLLVQGNANPEQHACDADHIFDLAEHGGGYFITVDNRLLSLSDELFCRYFVTTIKPCDYEQLLHQKA